MGVHTIGTQSLTGSRIEMGGWEWGAQCAPAARGTAEVVDGGVWVRARVTGGSKREGGGRQS